MTKRILLLSHSFPPYVYPESYLIVKRLGNLKNSQIDVLTMDTFFPWVRKDDEFSIYAEKQFASVLRLQPPSWYKKLPFSKGELLFSAPDAYLYLLPLYLKKLKSIDLKKYDVVITWSMYHSVHLLGPFLKRKNPDINWVAHFSDPWVNNPFRKRFFLTESINRYLEKLIFRKVDKVIFTSEFTLRNFKKTYPKCQQKASFIPHNFVDDLYPKVIDKNNLFLIRYIGSFYKERSPLPLIKALKILHNDHPNFLSLHKVRIELIGSSEFDISGILDGLPVGVVQGRLPVSYIESLNLMKESDLLLVIDAPFEDSPFLPSKISDYFGAEKPIFAICSTGTTRNIIEEVGLPVAHPNDYQEIANKLKLAIEYSFDTNSEKYQTQRDNFSKNTTEDKLLNIIYPNKIKQGAVPDN